MTTEAKAKMKSKRDVRRARGLCPNCGKSVNRRIDPESTLCENCSYKKDVQEESKYAGYRPCLCCRKLFKSPHTRRVQHCVKCVVRLNRLEEQLGSDMDRYCESPDGIHAAMDKTKKRMGPMTSAKVKLYWDSDREARGQFVGKHGQAVLAACGARRLTPAELAKYTPEYCEDLFAKANANFAAMQAVPELRQL